MFWAIKDNLKVEATPKSKAKCELCEREVFAKCGEVNIWHWSHHKGEGCDSWYEPESFWHKRWKFTFGKDNSEVVIKKDSEKHRADIRTKNDVVIELQNSPIQKQVIREREDFYGEKMIWLINGIDFKYNFNIKYRDNKFDSIGISQKLFFNWKHAGRSWNEVQRHVFIDFADDTLFWVKEGMGESFGGGVFVQKEIFINKYGGSFEYYQKALDQLNEDNKKIKNKLRNKKRQRFPIRNRRF